MDIPKAYRNKGLFNLVYKGRQGKTKILVIFDTIFNSFILILMNTVINIKV